jgi:hypothetical protein
MFALIRKRRSIYTSSGVNDFNQRRGLYPSRLRRRCVEHVGFAITNVGHSRDEDGCP